MHKYNDTCYRDNITTILKLSYLKCLSDQYVLFLGAGKTVPDMKLIRQHLQLEGQIEKECLVELIL